MNLLLFLIFSFDYSFKSRLNLGYDDNIYAYSKKYLDEFIHQIHPERFPFDTYDDLYTNYYIELLIRGGLFSRNTTTFNIDFTGYNYLINKQKDYSILSLGIRQAFGKFSTKFEYLFMPGYLIRYYNDPKNSEYIGCKFSENLFTLKISLKKSEAYETHLKIGYEIDDYIENFDAYDSKAFLLGPYFTLALSRVIQTGVSYELKSLKAKGPIPDISYLQHKIGINTSFKTCIPKFSKMAFAYQLKYRIFTTEVSPILDSPHSGREDVTHKFTITYEFPILTNLFISFDYAYELRISSSEIYPDIGDYKNYNKWMAGCGLEFKY
jgi:hypothetical protein